MQLHKVLKVWDLLVCDPNDEFGHSIERKLVIEKVSVQEPFTNFGVLRLRQKTAIYLSVSGSCDQDGYLGEELPLINGRKFIYLYRNENSFYWLLELGDSVEI